MNVIYAHWLLAAVTGEEGRVPVTTRTERQDLQEMAAARLLEIMALGPGAHPSSKPERSPDPSRAFPRAFPKRAPRVTLPVAAKERTLSEKQADSCAAAVGKWRNKFAAMHLAQGH